MTVHTILQVVCLFIIYTVLTVVLPELVFHQKYKGRRTGERLMLDITVSNFYIMNLVFILQLLHISSIYTLLIFTVMPVFAVIIIQYRKAFKAWGIRQLALLGKISSKTMGIKTFFAIVFTRIKDILCNACKIFFISSDGIKQNMYYLPFYPCGFFICMEAMRFCSTVIRFPTCRYTITG